jgi:hypothetical protein
VSKADCSIEKTRKNEPAKAGFFVSGIHDPRERAAALRRATRHTAAR